MIRKKKRLDNKNQEENTREPSPILASYNGFQRYGLLREDITVKIRFSGIKCEFPFHVFGGRSCSIPDLFLKDIPFTDDMALMIDSYTELGDLFLSEEYVNRMSSNFEKVWMFLLEIENLKRVYCSDVKASFLYGLHVIYLFVNTVFRIWGEHNIRTLFGS